MCLAQNVMCLLKVVGIVRFTMVVFSAQIVIIRGNKLSELSYKELQEQGVFDVPYRAFEFMQSQQAKIDGLKKQLTRLGYTDNGAELMKPPLGKTPDFGLVSIQRDKIDELQARIDEALRFYNEAKSPHNIGMMQMAIYLKGNKDEK